MATCWRSRSRCRAPCAVVFGFVPALRTSRVELTSLMNDLSPRHGVTRTTPLATGVSQMAVSLVLLIGAGLVLRSYAAAQHADGGFDSANVTAVAIDLQTPATTSRAAGRNHATARCLRRRARVRKRHPGAQRPLSLVDDGSRAARRRLRPRSDEDMIFLYNIVAPDYFRTLRIPLLAGRDFARTDDHERDAGVMVNETLARRFWQTPENAIGKRLRSGTRMADRDRRRRRPQIFAPVGTAAAVRLFPAAADLRPPHGSRAHARRPAYAMRRVREQVRRSTPRFRSCAR